MIEPRYILEPINPAAATTPFGGVPGDSFEHLSCDSISKMNDKLGDFDELYPTEFLNSIVISNFPHHKLVLKVGCPVMLLRNIDQTMGLCNGTRLIITRLATRVVEATIMTGSHIGDTVYIPRIILMSKKSKFPFVLERRQYPLRLCYAMTINKSQGQTLDSVGIYLKETCFYTWSALCCSLTGNIT